MRFSRDGEKGSASGYLLSASALLLAVFLGALLIRHYLGVRAPRCPQGSPSGTEEAGSFQGDPAEATERLLAALNRKLGDLDLLKLLSREVDTSPVTVQGKPFLTYHEEFRLPMRYSVEEIARHLEPTAQTMGARMEIGAQGDLTFNFNSEWTPVVISLTTPIQPRVCLIIDDGGYQRGKALTYLYALKVPVTVAIIPDVEFSSGLAEEFPAHGVEVMCHMPMEGHEKGVVGGDYREFLKKGMGSSEAKENIEKALEDLPNCRGLNNHMGSVATTDPELMGDVCQILKTKGLFIIDSRTTAQSVVETVARKEGLPVARRDVFLDNVENPKAILSQLDQLVRKARKNGFAVGIGHFKAITLETLDGAVGPLKEQGIQFVYASEVVKE